MENTQENKDNLIDLSFLQEPATESNLEDPKSEELLFMTALKDECTPEEYREILESAGDELELYGLITSKEIVTESQRNIVKLNKMANFNKVQKRAAISLAAKDGNIFYEKYAKFRKLMIENRIKIYEKYANKSKMEARKSISNSRRKASAMKSPAGKSIVAKMDKQISKLDKDTRNGSAIKD